MKKSIVISTLLLLVTACAPGLGSQTEITALPQFETSKSHSLDTYSLHVGQFSDERGVQDSIKINDRSVKVAGSLGTVVQSGLEDAIKDMGGSLCLFNCTTIEGSIVNWELKAKPEFPTTKVESRATLSIRILAQDGTILFQRSYSGTFNGEHPLYTEERLQAAFGGAMNEAIKCALEDPELLRVVKK